MKYIFLIITLATCSVKITAQNYIQLDGSVEDKSTGDPVAYAHIAISNSSIGTVANDDGDFSFKIPMQNKSDTLIISAIGFASEKIQLKGISSETTSIKLTPKSQVLDEVVIKPVDAESVIRALIKNIPDNYGTETQILTGFYRETVKINGAYYSYLEGLVSAYKTNYQEDNIKNDQVKIIKGRAQENKLAKDSLRRPPNIRSGPNTFNTYDLVKTRASFISEKHIKRYTYELEDITTYNGNDVYVISFRPKKKSKKAVSIGQLYIEIDSKALIKAVFKANETGIEIINKKKISHSRNSPYHVTATGQKATISYHKVNGIWTLQQVQVSLLCEYLIKELMIKESMDMSIHLITTDIKRGQFSAFGKDEVFSQKEAFENNLGEEDPDFWANYNVLKRNNALEEAFDN